MSPVIRVLLKSSRIQLLVFSALLVLASLVHLPGKSGPFIFDDYSNLHDNSYLKIKSLDPDSLYYAANSLDSGPLRRPVAMLSFAVNYYFAGSLADATPYKLTNIVIHAINGLLLFWLVRLVWVRLVPARASPAPALHATGPAFFVALLWIVHPIQTMSVLYVVQRMTELSTLFSLLAMIFYMKGRLRIAAGAAGGLPLALGGVVICGTLGILSKENALLLPVYVLLFELALFRDQRPWSLWHRLTIAQKRTSLAVLALALGLMLVGIIQYALPGYANRPFSMPERLLTQGRVLFFYLSLILIPRIDQFGHQHDNIEISTGLFDPWTTLPALLGHASLIALALWLVATRRQLAVGIGLLWFYVGHGLESTFIALEIAHEHRNYLPSAGVFLALAGLVMSPSNNRRARPLLRAMPVLLVIAYGTVGLQRAMQWADYNSFYRYEAMHHPNSARTHAGLALLLQDQGDHEGAIKALLRAAEINPKEPGYLVQIQMLRVLKGMGQDPEIETRIERMLDEAKVTATTFMAMQHITKCLQSWCSSLQVPLEKWTRIVLNRDTPPGDVSYFYYALGLALASQNKIPDAIESLRISYELDPSYLHPLFALASIQVQMADIDGAQQTLELLRAAHRQDRRYPRFKEMTALENDIEKLRLAQTAPTRR
jgi:tetratricopeptide (TPR) repeat protein